MLKMYKNNQINCSIEKCKISAGFLADFPILQLMYMFTGGNYPPKYSHLGKSTRFGRNWIENQLFAQLSSFEIQFSKSTVEDIPNQPCTRLALLGLHLCFSFLLFWVNAFTSLNICLSLIIWTNRVTVAQMASRSLHDPKVVGSNPTGSYENPISKLNPGGSTFHGLKRVS